MMAQWPRAAQILEQTKPLESAILSNLNNNSSMDSVGMAGRINKCVSVPETGRNRPLHDSEASQNSVFSPLDASKDEPRNEPKNTAAATTIELTDKVPGSLDEQAPIFASYGILRASHGDPVTSWKYQPSVYLAILTAMSNKTLAFACVQGTVVTFWLHALRGTTLGDLHRDWSYGRSDTQLAHRGLIKSLTNR
ncbi:hypothetical protein LTR09_004332 [Extremus antarcticus]|uniref:Uncharacterized protein n=1 Tax=Extremus antarcticus TaxID=702011 RepID=A0AAJ0GDW4_9PEZI|nr:hypothetical protein LTR09_004332 [Extremus antarcticus]